LRILVPVKRVPDPYGQIHLTATGEFDASGVKWVVNPFDEIAIEEAVRLRERGLEVEIVAISVGGDECEPILRTALAMGADRAILVEHDGSPDPAVVARLLAAAAEAEKPDLVLMGKQAIDDDSSQVGPRLAARLDLPQATFASSIEIAGDGRSARVTREVDAGRETLEVALPAVITTDLRLNEPRYVALPAILKARGKPLVRVPGERLAPAPSAQLRIVSQTLPPAGKPGRRVGSVAELVAALRDEAKVL
jgi:electron transfer flavoprotein beta subunit